MASVGKSFNITAAVDFGSNLSSNANAYTAPATGYAIVTLAVEAAGDAVRFQVGGRSMFITAAGGAGLQAAYGVYVGPGKAVSFSNNTSLASVFVVGVEFTNT